MGIILLILVALSASADSISHFKKTQKEQYTPYEHTLQTDASTESLLPDSDVTNSTLAEAQLHNEMN